MKAVLFCGIQASGKTTFYVERFLKTHLRISLDLLHTRNKETRLLDLCFSLQQRFVVDNTNVTRIERLKYITAAKASKFKVIGYYFHTELSAALLRNQLRTGKECIPVAGIKGTYKKMELPSYTEGFDVLYWVELTSDGFVVKPCPLQN